MAKKKEQPKEPRGFRNCNPMNLRLTKDKWVGLSKDAFDPEFFVFSDMKYGYRAAFITLYRYIQKHGCDTIEKICARWAPAGDGNNNPESYARQVELMVHWPKDYPVLWKSMGLMCSIAHAMTYVECGKSPQMRDVIQGYNLAKSYLKIPDELII